MKQVSIPISILVWSTITQLFCSLPQRLTQQAEHILDITLPPAPIQTTIVQPLTAPRQPNPTQPALTTPTSTQAHSQPLPQPLSLTALIQPQDLTYLGAFRLPEASDGSSWEYSGYGMTYYPDGDPDGANDGYPGTLFAIGHDHQQMVSEISIPQPIISTAKNSADLNIATTMQPFNDITNGMFGYLELPRADIEYLPAQDGQTTGKLHFCWGQHFEFENAPTHGWSGLNLSNPQPAGTWHIDGYTNYVTNDYLFEIPASWANANAPGLRLATGRFRDGTWGGLGPALLAIAPWTEGNPPNAGATLDNVKPLLMYGINNPGIPELDVDAGYQMIDFGEADEWSGGAWLTAGERSAVILVGTKATGRNWYGYANGVEYPTSGDPNQVIPDMPPWPYDDRGWWSEGIAAQMLFYNPDDLAAVARGETNSWVPQPYAIFDLLPYLFDPSFDHEREKRYLVGAVAFDRANGFLYVIERRADGDKSLVHVFLVK